MKTPFIEKLVIAITFLLAVAGSVLILIIPRGVIELKPIYGGF